MKKIINKESGFTLIEVVLVLAIGALIILMALLAFNGASRSRRDTARTNAAGVFVAALEQYASNTNGQYPANATDMTLTSAMQDPLTKTPPANGTGVDGTAPTKIVYAPGLKCSSSTAIGGSNSGGYAVIYKQESGTVVCKDNL